MKRELAIKKYAIPSIWKESKYNNYSFLASSALPIKDSLSKFVPDVLATDMIKITPSRLHRHLLANHSQ